VIIKSDSSHFLSSGLSFRLFTFLPAAPMALVTRNLTCSRVVFVLTEKGIELKFIQPGKPQQNAFIERFNRTYRHEVLSAHIFENLNQVKDITEQWIKIYNEDRPHAALGKLSPINYQ
jgi:transposase InsO family protein